MLELARRAEQSGDLRAAEQAYRQAASQGVAGQLALSQFLTRQRRDDEALLWFERARPRLAPGATRDSHHAALLLALDRPAEALVAANAALSFDPAHPGALHNAALAHRRLGQWLEAASCFETLSATQPERRADAAECLRQSARAARPLAALPLLQRAVALNPGHAQTALELANLLHALGEAEVAQRTLEQALARNPDLPDLHSATLIARQFDADLDDQQVGAAARLAGAAQARRAPAQVDASRRDPRCIGLYSPRFSAGPMARLILPLLDPLRRAGWRLALFSGHAHAAAEQAPFRAAADHWFEVADGDDPAFARQVADAGVSTMIDLCGHAPGHRLPAFAARLAPRQISYGDWFASTGLPHMDVFLADAETLPAGAECAFSETVWRLPSRFSFPSRSELPAPMPEVPERPRFASFNRLSKLTRVTLDVWAALLRRCPDADLHLVSGGLEDDAIVARIRARFAAQGVDPLRIQCDGFSDYATLIERYRAVSVALDPFPFNGCVTSLDALALDVPLLALRGRTLVARQSAALLRAHGCADWIADSAPDYIARAAELLRPECNQAARQRLADCATRSPLFQPEGLVAALDAMLRAGESSR